MATYVMSDIHGQYEMFMDVLDQIQLKEEDTLYVLGDVLDRGPHPVKVLRKLMEMPNVVCIVGNHELMAMECLEFLMQEVTEESIEELDERALDNLVVWQINGSQPTIDEFRALSKEMRQEVVGYIKDFSLYEEVEVDGTEYLLVHAGLGNYEPGKDIEEYSLHDLVWERADYKVQYFEDAYVVSGHTPTQMIRENDRPGYIYKKNHHIAIDCGSHIDGGRLACICLDTGEEFYSKENRKVKRGVLSD